MNRLFCIVVLLATSVALSNQALAHTHLTQATPGENSVVKVPPTEIDLHFSEAVEAKFTKVEIKGADGKDVPVKSIAGGAGDEKMLVVIPASPLAAGSYQVFWRAVSVDTHTSEGSYSFTVQP